MPLPLAKGRWGFSPQPEPQPERSSSCRSQLEQDVKRLRKTLQEETALHAVLEGALGRAAVTLADMAYLPTNAQELLSNICILETAVTKLEEEMVSLHFQLIQERNERRLVEYRLKHLPPSPTSACSCHSGKLGPDDTPGGKCTSQGQEVYPRAVLQEQAVKLQRQISVKGFADPNQLSEDIVRCMRNIFLSLSDSCRDSRNSSMENQQSIPSPTGNYSISAFWSLSEPSSISSWVQSPQVDLNYNNNLLASETVFDPYKAREKLSWADIGSYSAAAEVSWMSVGKKQLEYAAESLRKFRLFIEQLAEINPIHLNDDARLAFWINLYNALMMHAYLAYGVPRSDMKLFSLMQKAAYTIGGHSFSAAFIEYVILKMKPPNHRPQMALLLALQKIKVPEEQKKFCIVVPEPLLTFALSCGMYSSPGVKIYTANNVREELQDAQRDFIRASVGVSRKGKLLVPKILHCFARGFVDDNSFPIWISHFLPQQQATFVDHCVSQRRQSLLGTRTFGIIPFDSRFRYLFLPDTGSLN